MLYLRGKEVKKTEVHEKEYKKKRESGGTLAPIPYSI